MKKVKSYSKQSCPKVLRPRSMASQPPELRRRFSAQSKIKEVTNEPARTLSSPVLREGAGACSLLRRHCRSKKLVRGFPALFSSRKRLPDSSQCCNVMKTMKTRKKHATHKAVVGVTRITVSVPTPDYEQVMRIAENKRVSVSWVVRDAVDKYLSADMPLFAQAGKASS